jgi:hypothetical protein
MVMERLPLSDLLKSLRKLHPVKIMLNIALAPLHHPL